MSPVLAGGGVFVVTDLVNQPPHYKANGIEVIDIIEAFELSYHRGNALKYLLRAGRKDNELQDLQKLLWYVQREIERVQK